MHKQLKTKKIAKPLVAKTPKPQTRVPKRTLTTRARKTTTTTQVPAQPQVSTFYTKAVEHTSPQSAQPVLNHPKRLPKSVPASISADTFSHQHSHIQSQFGYFDINNIDRQFDTSSSRDLISNQSKPQVQGFFTSLNTNPSSALSLLSTARKVSNVITSRRSSRTSQRIPRKLTQNSQTALFPLIQSESPLSTQSRHSSTTTPSSPQTRSQNQKQLRKKRLKNSAFKSTRRALGRVGASSLDRAALSRGEHLEILSFTQTLGKLTPFLWPKGDVATKARLLSAMGCLIISKLLNVAVPVIFKEAIDELTIKIPALQTPKLKKMTEAAATAEVQIDQTAAAVPIPDTLASSPKPLSVDAQFDQSQFDPAVAMKKIPKLEELGTEIESLVENGSINDPDTQRRYIDHFLDFLQSPDFINVSTSQLPFAVLTAWGIVRILGSLTNELKNALFTRISSLTTTSLAVDLMRHLMHMDPAFHLDRNTGSISRAIDRGTKSIGLALGMITFRVIPTFFEMCLVVSVLATTCGHAFSAVAIATLITYIAFTVVVTQWRTKFKQRMNQASNTASSVAFDALINVEAVQRFNNEELETSKYRQAWVNYGQHQVKNESSLAFLNWGQSAIFSVGLTATMLLSAQGVMDGSLTVGDLVLANALLLQLSLPLNIVGTVYRELKQSVLDMQTMFALRQTKSQITNIENPIDFGPRLERLHRAEEFREQFAAVGGGDIADSSTATTATAVAATTAAATTITPTPTTAQADSSSITTTTSPQTVEPHLDRTGGFSLELNDIKFRYPHGHSTNLLDGISVKVPAGTSIAFVGGSGSGKSTVLKLAARIFDVNDGVVLIDGIPIKDIELSSLRKTIGIVPQETILFNDTIMANIRYARPEASDEEVINAAKLAQIHDSIVGMKDGYHTLVGERGLKISGGQKQRVSIARLMLLNPPVVMCDEATSALDSQTEYDIMQNLRNLTKQSRKTCVYVAHRLSTITHCDQIAVIEGGKVVELGTHHQLLNGNGKGTSGGKRYAAMWSLQSTVKDEANFASQEVVSGEKAIDEKL